MEKKQVYILVGLGVAILTTLSLIYFIKRKKNRKMVLLTGGYVVPKGTPNMVDALHSFERRKSDGFGGRVSTQIKQALVEMYNKGINPDITELKIYVDSANYKVVWEAKIEPSKDGKAYTGFMTYGSAGSGADSRAINQESKMKQLIGGNDYKLVFDFKNPKGIYIRQFFHKYTKDEFPSHTKNTK